MPEVIYEADKGPRQIEVKEYAHPEGERGVIHYYEGKKHISGDEFAEYMRPGFQKERQEYIAENANAAKEWSKRQREGNLIYTDTDKSDPNYGRLLDEDGELINPYTKRNKAQKAGDAVVDAARAAAEGLGRISKEAKDNAIKAIIANDIERARQILADAGIKLEDVASGNTKVYTEKTGSTDVETVVNPPKGREKKSKPNSFAEKNPEVVLRLIKDLQERMEKAQKEQTILDFSDKSLREKVEDQLRNKVIEDYIDGLPDDQKAEAKKQKAEIIEAMKMSPEDIEALSAPKNEIYLNGEDDSGKYVIRVIGGKVQINRSVDENWKVVGNGESTWFDYGNGPLKGRINLSAGPEKAGTDVDAEAMDASFKRLEEIQAEMASSPTPERMAELIKEFAEERAKAKEIWEKGDDVIVGTEDEPSTLEKDAKDDGRRRFRSRFRDAWNALRGRPIAAEAAAAAAAVEESGAGGDAGGGGTIVDVDESGEPIKKSETETKEETKEEEKKRRLGVLIPVLGGGALVAAGVGLEWLLMRHGHTPGTVNNIKDYREYFINFWHGGFSGIGPDHLPVHHFDLSQLHPNSIHAQTPDQFQHGVLDLLRSQGVPIHTVTPEKIAHMNQFMEAHNIASGMKEGGHGLEQNLTGFPHAGQEFANAHASAEQGFHLGADGTGKAALEQWAKEAQRIDLIG